MNIYNVDLQVFDEMATDYLNGMYESQYDDTKDKDKTKKNKNEDCDLDDVPF